MNENITSATEVIFNSLSINSQNKLKHFSKKAIEYFKGSKIYTLEFDNKEVENVERLLELSGYFVTRILNNNADYTLNVSVEDIQN